MPTWTANTENRETGKKKAYHPKTHAKLKALLTKIESNHNESIESMEVDPE